MNLQLHYGSVVPHCGTIVIHSKLSLFYLWDLLSGVFSSPVLGFSQGGRSSLLSCSSHTSWFLPCLPWFQASSLPSLGLPRHLQMFSFHQASRFHMCFLLPFSTPWPDFPQGGILSKVFNNQNSFPPCIKFNPLQVSLHIYHSICFSQQLFRLIEQVKFSPVCLWKVRGWEGWWSSLWSPSQWATQETDQELMKNLWYHFIQAPIGHGDLF